MEIDEAIDILEQHNKWRRDNDNKYNMTNVTKLGIAIYTIIEYHKNESNKVQK